MSFTSWKSFPSWFLFFMTVLTGLMMILSSDNWFMAWMGLELTLLGFMPLLVSSTLSTEGAIKYFLVQAGGSTLFIMSFMTKDMYSDFIYIVSMSLKLGLSPFHQWVPTVVSSISMPNIMILLTVQKMGPLIMIMKTYFYSLTPLIIFSLLSVFTGGMGGVNQTHMTPLIAYSSIAHTGWVVMSTLVSMSLCTLYFTIYSASVVFLTAVMMTASMSKIYKMNSSTKNKSAIALLMLNLSSLPPFPLFMGKLLVTYALILKFPTPIIMAVMLSSITTYMYLYNVIPSSNMNFKKKWSGM